MSDGENVDSDNTTTFHQQGQTVYGKQYNIGRVEGENIHLGDKYYQTTRREATFPISNLPPINLHFVGREGQLRALANTGAERTMTITQAITGLGGVGKSQLMLHYAHQHRAEYDVIWWLRADEALNEDFIALGRQLALEVNELTDQAAAVQLVRGWLNGADKRWLLLFDNADRLEPRQLRPYLPTNKNGRILITSRNPAFSSLGELVRLDVFTEQEAAVFWTEKLGAAERFGDEVAEAKARVELAGEIGGLPLALEHAAAYMLTRQKDTAGYLNLYRARRQALWARTPAPDDYHATITTTWEIGFEQARQTPGAAELLNLCCFLAPDDIPLALIVDHAGVLPEELGDILSDELDLDDALLALERYSLLERVDNTLNIHRLVQTVARDRMGAERSKKWVAAAVDFLAEVFYFDHNDMTTIPLIDRLMPHLQAAIGLADKFNLYNKQTGYLNNEVAEYMASFGNMAGSRPYYDRALAIREQVLGPEHPDTAQSLNDLGGMLVLKGEYAEAQPLLDRALAIREEVLGAEHPDTAESLEYMGYLFWGLGDLAAVKTYFERSLAIREKALGAEHPDTAMSLNHLGRILIATGDLAGARPFYEQALAIREKVLGAGHPDTAQSLNNLGYLLIRLGNPAAARPYYERALAIREKVFGLEHLGTANSLNNLGDLLQKLGDLAGARAYHEQGLAVREKVLGTEHPDTAESLKNMGYLLQEMGDLAGAKAYQERALAIREKVLGPEHPDTAESLNNLGHLLQGMGDLAGAKPYYERALAIRERVLGVEHPETAMSFGNMAGILEALNDLDGAKPYRERALAIHEHTLGPDNPVTATSLNNLGALLVRMDDLAGARPYFERALAINETALGAEHPNTAENLNNLGYLHQALDDLAGAKPHFQRALAIREKVLGPDHPDTAQSYAWWGVILRAEGRTQEAQSYFQRAYDIYRRVLGPKDPRTISIRTHLT